MRAIFLILGILCIPTFSKVLEPKVPDPEDLFNAAFGFPSQIQDFLLALYTHVGLQSTSDFVELQNFTFNYEVNGWLIEGQGQTFKPVVYGLSAMRAGITVDDATNDITSELVVPKLTIAGFYNSLMILGPITYEGRGRFVHTFYDLRLSANYTLRVNEVNKVQATEVKPKITISNCSLYAEEYTYNGYPVDWEWLSLYFKLFLDEAFSTPGYGLQVTLAESVAWALNIPWGVMGYSLEEVKEELRSLNGS